jgi:hypothetical protein
MELNHPGGSTHSPFPSLRDGKDFFYIVTPDLVLDP